VAIGCDHQHTTATRVVRDAVREVLAWTTDDRLGETALLCRLMDGDGRGDSCGVDGLPWRRPPEPVVGAGDSPPGWRLPLARAESACASALGGGRRGERRAGADVKRPGRAGARGRPTRGARGRDYLGGRRPHRTQPCRSFVATRIATAPARPSLGLVRKLAVHTSDQQIAAILNTQGRRTGTGPPFNQPRVAHLRTKQGLPAAPPLDSDNDQPVHARNVRLFGPPG
jgi:hypothetical protein